MEHIGEILRTAREDNFYTQKKVIELTGINRKTLSGYENSVAEPDLDTFARLLRLYQLSADEVLGIKTSTPPRIFPFRAANEKCLLFSKNFDTSHQEELLIQFQSLADYLDKKIKIKLSLLFPALTIYNELILCLKGEHFHERYW